MTDKLFFDCEANVFGITRNHEYMIQTGNYRYHYTSDLHGCIRDFDTLIDRLQKFAPHHQIVCCLGHHSNFRYGVYTQYKSNRRGVRKAACYGDMREHIEKHFETSCLPNVEADDAVGIQYEYGDLIYSADKDLKTIAGIHLQENGDLEIVSQLEANRSFYKQILCGDASDGYRGCPGIGEKHKCFDSDEWMDCAHERDFWTFVQKRFALAHAKVKEVYGTADTLSVAMQMARLARILRPGEYDFDNDRPVLWAGPG